MTTVRIAKSKFSFIRKCLGLSQAKELRKRRMAIKESPADPEIVWVRLVTDREHRMSAVPDQE
jgi:hypothetical protein